MLCLLIKNSRDPKSVFLSEKNVFAVFFWPDPRSGSVIQVWCHCSFPVIGIIFNLIFEVLSGRWGQNIRTVIFGKLLHFSEYPSSLVEGTISITPCIIMHFVSPRGKGYEPRYTSLVPTAGSMPFPYDLSLQYSHQKKSYPQGMVSTKLIDT